MYEQIARNKRDSVLLFACIFVILCLLGYVIGFAQSGSSTGGIGFLGIFGIIAIVWSLVGYYHGAKMVLAVTGAKEIQHDDNPELFNVVDEMRVAAGLPMPKVYLIDDPAPNAFATGRDPDHSAIAITSGLLERLTREELQGVIAHEMSHVRNFDIRFATLIGILVGFIALISDFFLRVRFFGGGRRDSGGGGLQGIMIIVALVLAILAPIVATIVQFAISRRREFLADASGAQLTRDPLGLAGALEKIAADTQPLKHANRATAHLYIANPLGKKKTKETAGMFDTHPPILERINILRAMAHLAPEQAPIA
jgi:heat shock protein HtpX